MRPFKRYITIALLVLMTALVSCRQASHHDEALALYNKGVELREAKHNEEAAKAFGAALVVIDRCDSENVENKELKAKTEDRLGEIYWLQGLFEEALELHLDASALFRELGKSEYLMKAYRNAGRAAASLNNLDDAEYYYNESLIIAKSLKDNVFIADLYLDLSRDIYMQNEDYERVISFVNQALASGADTDQCHLLLGVAYYYLEDDENAIMHLEEAAKSDKAGARMSAYDALYLISQLNGDYQQALEYHELYNENMIEADHEHRSEEMQRIKSENDLKIQESALKEKQKVRLGYLFGALGLLAIALIIMILLLRQRALRAQIESEKTKNQFEAALKKNKVYVTALALTEQITASTLDFQLDNDSWDDFINLINLIYNDLNNKLIAKYPSLTQEDLKICSLTRLGFSNQVIAILMNTQTASYARRKSRIKQEKMNGNEDERSFEEIIENI
ncbi:MAG: tetratricopeptide repeat protein [Bacteroidales bacterium]|nr:tetratricopeptide repeat protein [Bacteroidales bacterium]